MCDINKHICNTVTTMHVLDPYFENKTPITVFCRSLTLINGWNSFQYNNLFLTSVRKISGYVFLWPAEGYTVHPVVQFLQFRVVKFSHTCSIWLVIIHGCYLISSRLTLPKHLSVNNQIYLRCCERMNKTIIAKYTKS